MTIYGIDLGTTNSAAALDGKLVTDLIPSIASFEDKRAGKKYKNDYRAERSFKVDMTVTEEGKLPMASSALVLREIVREAKENNHDIQDVVISIPAYFNELQREATIKSAKLAKLNVVRLINEPTAAAIAIAKEFKGLFVIYDLGGGTHDVSIIDSRFGMFDVIANDGMKVGGDNIDKAIYDHVLSNSKIRALHMSPELEISLKLQAEKAKIHIAETETSFVFDLTEYPRLDGSSDEYELTPEKYERLVRQTLHQTAIRTRALVEKNLDGEEYKLALVGGSTKCPYVTKFIEEILGQESEKLEYDPDTIVAEGASIYANLVESGEDVVLVQDVTKAIGILNNNGNIVNIIPNNAKIPLTRKTVWSSMDEGVKGMRIEVYQGESVLPENNEHLGTLLYDLSKEYSAGTLTLKIEVAVTIDGLVKVTVQEPLQPAKSIAIKRPQSTKESEVTTEVEESSKA